MEAKAEIFKKACELAMKAHKSIGNSNHHQYLYEEIPASSVSDTAVFAFAGSSSVNDWFSHNPPFGETNIDMALFPCLRSIGRPEETALVNASFARRFELILSTSSLAAEVEKAALETKQVVFAGHSSGGPMAILTALWFLNNYTRTNGNVAPLCVTFGSPLVGNQIFPRALRRENWDSCFYHFVVRCDIVPLMMLAPLSSIEQELPRVLKFFNLEFAQSETILTSSEASTFFTTVMQNASSVASHDASNLMGCTNLLLNTFSSFIELSPYRPFGTYVFCKASDSRAVVVQNSNAVLQMLLNFSQLGNEADSAQVAYTRLREHLVYEEALNGRIGMQNFVHLEHLQGTATEDTKWDLNGLGLRRRAVLCLRAAEEAEKQKRKNEKKIKKAIINEELRKMLDYQTDCERRRKVGYYDAFKLQNDEKDFKANTTRLVLAGIWDDIIEMVKKLELPDEFEGKKEWIMLGTQFRRLVEPIDVANYYRDGKYLDGGSYLQSGRPNRYKFPQRWLEYNERGQFESISESCFMAEIEELNLISNRSFIDLQERVVKLERLILNWDRAKVLSTDVFLDKSTFSKWWNSLPEHHKLQSCIQSLFSKYKERLN